MVKDDSRSVDSADTENLEPVPWGLLLMSWILPGLGHFILGKRVRGAVFAGVILSAFVTGVLLNGEIGVPHAGDPFSWLSTMAGLGNGILYFLRLFWVNGIGAFFANLPLGLSGGGDPALLGFSYGKTFLISAGLMNLLVVLDVSDVARGVKK